MPQSNSAPQSASNRHWGFSTAGRVFFGWGVSEELRTISKELGKRAMICTDKNMVKSGIADKVEALLKEGGAEVLVYPGRPSRSRSRNDRGFGGSRAPVQARCHDRRSAAAATWISASAPPSSSSTAAP